MTPERIAELVQSAIDQSNEDYQLLEVLEEIVSGRSVLFQGERSILVANLHKHNETLTAHGWLGAGDLDELTTHIMPQAQAWATAQGATRMTITGRRGWVRALKNGGFSEESVTVGKDIS